MFDSQEVVSGSSGQSSQELLENSKQLVSSFKNKITNLLVQ
jgi:hypothetical protein